MPISFTDTKTGKVYGEKTQETKKKKPEFPTFTDTQTGKVYGGKATAATVAAALPEPVPAARVDSHDALHAIETATGRNAAAEFQTRQAAAQGAQKEEKTPKTFGAFLKSIPSMIGEGLSAKARVNAEMATDDVADPLEAAGLGFAQGTGAFSLGKLGAMATAGLANPDPMMYLTPENATIAEKQREDAERLYTQAHGVSDAINVMRQEAQAQNPLAYGAGEFAGNVAMMGTLGKGVSTATAGSTLPAWAKGAITGGTVIGGGAAIKGAGEAATGTITPGEYARSVAAGTLGGAAGGIASSAVANAGLKLLRSFNKPGRFVGAQNKVLPNILLGGAASAAYGAASAGVDELSKYITEEDYTPDWGQIGKSTLTTAAFGMISYAINLADTTAANKQYLEATSDYLRRKYELTLIAFEDSTASAAEKAYYAEPVIAEIDAFRNQVLNLHVPGGNDEVSAINNYLLSVEQELFSYLRGLPVATESGAAAAGVPTAIPGVSGAMNITQAAENPTVPATVAAAGAPASKLPQYVPVPQQIKPEIPQQKVGATNPAALLPAPQPEAPKPTQADMLPAPAQTMQTITETPQPATTQKKTGENALTPTQAQITNVMVSNIINYARKQGVDLSEFYAQTEGINAFRPERTDIPVLIEALGKVNDAIKALPGNTYDVSFDKYLKTISGYGETTGPQATETVNPAAPVNQASLLPPPEGTQPAQNPMKGPDFNAWDGIINEGRLSGMSPQEQKAVKSVFEKPAEQQTPAETVRATLANSGRVTVNGMEYSLTQIAGPDGNNRWVSGIRSTDGDALGGMIRNARNLYTGYSDTREDAISDLIAVAENNGLFWNANPHAEVALASNPGYNKEKAPEKPKEEASHGNIQGERGENHQGVARAQAEDGNGPAVQGGNREIQQNAGRETSLDRTRGKSVAQEASEEISEYHAESEIIKDSEWDRNEPAYTKNGKVYLKETIPEELRGMIAPHEGTHLMRQARYAPYIDFIKRTPDMMNIPSAGFARLMDYFSKRRGVDLFSLDGLKEEDQDRAIEIAYDELIATLYGHIAASKYDEELMAGLKSAFKDLDAYFKELDAIHEQFKKSRGGRSATDGSGDNGGSDVKAPAKPHEQLADALLEKLKHGEKITSKDLAALAEQAFGGTRAQGAYDIKTAYDCLELAVNKYLLTSPLGKGANVDLAEQAVSVLHRIEDKLSLIPTQTVRTEEQQQFQQFSTPPNIAYLAAWAANIAKSDTVLEPSAGIGGLAVFPKAWGATVYGNELSPRRAEILRSLGLDEVFTENAEQIDNVLPDYVKPSVVLMNPPFSSTAGRTNTNSTANAKRHIEQALSRLEDGGRLVAILGRGMSNDSKTFSKWWDSLRGDYDIRANLSINGENYKKYGTTFDVQLVVIDKTGAQKGETVTGEYKDLSEIPAILEGIRNDRVQLEGQAAAADGRGAEWGNQPVPAGRGSGVSERRPAGISERDSGNRSVSDAAGAAAGAGNRGRLQPGRADADVAETGSSTDGQRVGKSGDEDAGGAAVESQSEHGRDTGPESELSVQGLTPKKPRTSTATKAAKNDDGVFTEYQPPKTPVKGAKKHPAVLVESAAMGAVNAPEATYTPNLPKELISSGALSDAQISNIVYAGQAHSQMIPMQNKRKGYFIGDGTGVGKGRQISGIILDNFRQGRDKALWISKGQNLFTDAQRDWSDIGGNKDQVFNLSKIKADMPVQAKNGILFTTYHTLAAQSKSKKSRLDQIVNWLGKDFDGVIAFDEAHNMGNLLGKKSKFNTSKPSDMAIAGNELQKRLPKARIVYVSATMATDVNEMAFADRLGLWGPGTQFSDVNDFVNKISRGGIAAMELVARDMKAMGVYQARSISYNGVEYDTLQHDLTPMQKEIYDTLSRAWQVTLKNMDKALDITGAKNNGQARAAAKSAYYGAMQRFYNQIITSMAVPSVIEDMKNELAAGRSVVLQIVNTNEAETNRQLAAAKESGASLDDLDITPREALISFLRKSFPVQAFEEYTDDEGNVRSRPVLDSNGKPVQDKKAVAMRDRMIAEVEQMSVPEGPLEMIYDAFGVDQVAEVTGRKRRIVPGKDNYGNSVKVEEKRSEKSNEADVQAFQDGRKRILIFSDAGGTGKSYHADKRAKNQQQRVHYLLQPGWSAPKAVQGFGRTHRSNEVSAPIYKLVTTDVRGQKRFVSTIARRLDQLGALTKGQRQTGSGMFSAKDNLESDLAMDSLSNFYKQLGQNRLEGLDGETILSKLGLADKFHDEWGNFRMNDVIGRDMNTFLNRIMALEYDEQNAVFDAFSRIFDDAYDTALSNGTLDMGMETVRADKIEILDDTVIRTDEATGATTNYVQAQLSEKTRILSTVEDLRTQRGDFLGLYKKENGHVYGVYRTADKTLANGSVVKQFILQTPQVGVISKYVESTFKNEMTRVPEKQWAKAWAEEVKQTPTHRESVRHMLTGTLLPIWNRLPDSGNVKVQRLIADDGRQYLGRIIPDSQIDDVLKSLGAKGRTKQTYTPEQVTKAIYKDGKKAILQDNRVTLSRKRVGNEWRIEINGNNLWFLKKNVPDIYTEYINFQERYFVPNGEKQQATVDAILKLNPLKDVENEPKGIAPGDTIEFPPTQYSRDNGEKQSSGILTPHPERWTTERVGDKDKAPMRTSDVIEKIRHDFGINITKGHVRGAGVRGTYNPQNHGIRSRLENDLPTIAHELGHHLDDLYDLSGSVTGAAKKELVVNLDDEIKNNPKYKEKDLPGEGVAEFLRRYLKNKDEAAKDYPEFTKYFLNTLSGPDQARIEVLADEINAIFSLDTDTATSSVRLMEEGRADFRTLPEKVRDKYDAFYQATFDSMYGIKRFEEATGARNVYKLATNAAYAANRAAALLKGDLRDIHGAYVARGLKSRLPKELWTNKELYREFGEYLIVKHGPERLAEGMDVLDSDAKNTIEWMNRRQAEIEAQHPEFEAISEDLYDFQKQFLQTWLVDTGLISQETADEWAERWEFYVPFNRAVPIESRGIGARRGFANQNSTIKKAFGSKLDIIHPVDNIINNMVKIVNAAVRNDVMQRITNAALKFGDANFLEKIPMPVKKRTVSTAELKKQLEKAGNDALLSGIFNESSAAVFELIVDNIDDVLEQYGRGVAHGDVVTVLKNGKPECWKINDPLLLQSVTNMAPAKMGAVLEAYGAVSRFMTGNITGNNLLWSIFSNAPRDLMTLFTYIKDKKHPLKVFAGIGSAYLNNLRGDNADEFFKEYLSMGGESTNAYTPDRDMVKRTREKMQGKNISANPLDWIAFMSDMIEMGPRYTTYKLMRLNGMTPEEAFYEAMDVTVNFKRGGTVSRQINKFIPFFNASVQGLDKFARWITAEDIPKEGRAKVARGRTMAWIAVSTALGALFYGLNNRDDKSKEEYARLSNYTKNSYWNVPLGDGKYFAIPKPREIAVLSSFFEAAMEYGLSGNEHAFDEFYNYAADTILPNMLSDIATGDIGGALGSLGLMGVVGNLVANRDFLGKPIVPNGMQYLEQRDQYNARTSKIAQVVGKAFGVSPMKVDYFFGQTLGGWWKAQKALFPVGSENVDYTLGIRNTYVKDNLYSTDLINRAYDRTSASTKAKNSDPGNIDKAITAKLDSNMTTFYSRYYSLAKANSEGEAQRGTRIKVFEMLEEYEKVVESDMRVFTPAMTAMIDAAKQQGDTDTISNYLPGVMPISVKDGSGGEHVLTDVQYFDFQTDYLRILYETVEYAIGPKTTDAERAAIVKAANTVARERAKETALSNIRAASTGFNWKYRGVKNDDIATFLAQIDLANDDGSLKQDEVIGIIRKMQQQGLSNKNAYVLFHAPQSYSDKNNPWAEYKN